MLPESGFVQPLILGEYRRQNDVRLVTEVTVLETIAFHFGIASTGLMSHVQSEWFMSGIYVGKG